MISCVDEVDLNIDTEQRTLVVDGFISDGGGDFQVSLLNSSVIGVGRDNILDPVPNATVNLLDSNGASFPYEEIEDGVYELKSFDAARGVAYSIDIMLSDGRHFQSKPDVIRSGSAIENISYSVETQSFRNTIGQITEEEVISVLLQTDITGFEDPPYLRWRIDGEYLLSENYRGAITVKQCFVKTNIDLNEIRIFDTSTLAGNELFDQVINETTFNFRFAEQFCYHIQQFSISEDEFVYWNNIKQIIEVDGGLFDPPPGTLVGNIVNVDDPSDIAVGYFSVASLSSQRAFVKANDLDLFVSALCEIRFGREEPFGCRECLDVALSSAEKPEYWVF